MFLMKAVRDAKNETHANELWCWEFDKEVNYCRDCTKAFSALLRKHHCRACGGVFCVDCTETGVELHGEKCDRACKGCVRGDTPGPNIRSAIEKMVQEGSEETRNSIKSRTGRRITASPVPLTYGGLFDGQSESSAVVAPEAGYFEFANKMGLFCCAKVVAGTDGSELASLWEVPRPAYAAVPPNGVVSGRFDPAISHIEITLLLSNPASSPGGDASSSVIYDSTRGETITPCAYVYNFRRYITFRVECLGKNVLLKYKGDIMLEPRLGTSIARVGIFGKLTGSRGGGSDAGSVIDFSTNVVASDIAMLSCSKR